MSKFSLLADAANAFTGITVTAPALLDATPIPGPVSDAGKEILTVVVGLFTMFLTKAAGKLFDKWFGKKEEKPVPVVEPQPESITLQKPDTDEKKVSK